VGEFAFGGVKTARSPVEKNRKVAEGGTREGGMEGRGLSRGEMEEMMGGLMEKMGCRMLEGMNEIKERVVEEMREFTREVEERWRKEKEEMKESIKGLEKRIAEEELRKKRREGNREEVREGKRGG